jgi:hypothetical protein
MNASVTPPATRASDSQNPPIERTLSVPQTGLLKFVLPVVWVALGGYAVWRVWTRPEEVLDADAGLGTAALKWTFLVLLAAGLIVLLAFVVPLKRVRLAPDGLRISNYIREITVPFSAIAAVRQNWLPTFRLITIDLRTETPLGQRVIFMPAGTQRAAFWRAEYRREDALVGELRRLARLA